MLVLRRSGAREDDFAYRFEECGAPTNHVLTAANDYLFRVCQRHRQRLSKLIVKKEK